MSKSRVQLQRLGKAIAVGVQSMKDLVEESRWHTMGHCAGRSHDKMKKNLIEESTPRDREDGGNPITLLGMSTEGMVIVHP
jgi:hypothetical protein